MQSRIVKTKDGSDTIYSSKYAQHYHSRFGAVAESRHVFIDHCLAAINEQSTHTFFPLHILEMGFGTGLNALLSLLYANQTRRKIIFETYEQFALPEKLISQLTYQHTIDQCKDDQNTCDTYLKDLHQVSWKVPIQITPFFTLIKNPQDFLKASLADDRFDGVYYDAFSPGAQPELWTQDVFHCIYQSMRAGGRLTTYCAKGAVRRALQAAGFDVVRTPGPPRKREMLVAIKK